MATSDDEPLLDAEDIPHTRDHAINTSEGGRTGFPLYQLDTHYRDKWGAVYLDLTELSA